MTTDRIGQQLGNYRIIQLLGGGGFADVYLGEHIYLKSQAAVKVLQTRMGGADDTDSFLKEAQTIARLFHPHIIRIMDFGIAAEAPYLVMDYAPKGTLRQKHPRGIPVPLTTVIPYVKQVADALQYAYDELRLIHRDIKPENMLIGRRDEILLSDFGIALVAQSSRYQGIQDVIGTVAYMAPEQIQGRPHVASDQYSLAVVVYEWLTGDRPFNGSFTEMCTQHIFASPPPLISKMPSLPPTVNLVVMQALAKNPQQRFESIQAFADALEQANLSQGGEQTEQMSSSFHSLLTTRDVDISYPPTLVPSSPTNTPSLPLHSAMSGQLSPSSAQPGQFLPPTSRNQQDTAQTGARENFTAPFPQSAQARTQPASGSTKPAQPPQQQVVLPSPPAYTPHYPPHPDNSQQANNFSSSYSSRAPQQPLRTEAPQQQVGVPRRSTPEPRNDTRLAHPDSGIQPDRQSVNTGQNEGFVRLTPLMRPFIATIIGIIIFCALNFYHPFIYGYMVLFLLAVPLFFGGAFGPIAGSLVGLGGVFCLNLINPSPYINRIFLNGDTISQSSAHYLGFSLLMYGLIGFMAGLPMLGKRRFPSIGSSIRSTFLGAIALFGSFGFIFYNEFGRRIILRLFVDTAILGSLNVLAAFALLVIYSIVGWVLGS